MPVLLKLNQARKLFHSRQLKKTGHNKFAGYNYFELADFLIPALEIFESMSLSAVVSFGTDLATMTLTDLEDASQFVITSPMSTASLKACHEVQNLGAVQTYLRRYLWVAALEIVEHDAIDSSEGAAPKTTQEQAVPNRTKVMKVTNAIKDHLANGRELGAYQEWEAARDDEDFAKAVWSGLATPERDQLRELSNQAKKVAA